jgi:hypothetical protein
MIPLGCRVDYWRNFVSYAPDIHILMQPSTKPVFVNLRDYIIQGAKTINHTETLVYSSIDPNDIYNKKVTTSNSVTGLSPIPDILDKIPTQRGWLLSYLQINLPTIGTTHPKQDSTGFYYQAGSGSDYEDCFNYAFTNGTQRSNIGRVYISVQTPFIENKPIDFKYTVLDCSVHQNDDGSTSDASTLVDGDLTTGVLNPQAPFVDITPVTKTAIQRTNLLLNSITYVYDIQDPTVQGRSLDVWRWDGLTWTLWCNIAAASSKVGKVVLPLSNPMPLLNGDPQLRIVVTGSWGGDSKPISALELIPSIIYSPSKYKAAVEKMNAS